jgi:hypothetical protein
MNRYEEVEFETKIEAALARVRTLLDHTKNPQYPAEVPHRYDDKYLLAEFVTRAATASLFQCIEHLGLTEAALTQLRGWARERSVSLRLSAHETCSFLREEVRKVEAAQETVTETRSFLGGKTTRTEKVVTNVTEYFWSFEFDYQIVAFQGADATEHVPIIARKGSIEVKTTARQTPRPRSVVRPFVDVNVTWLLQQLDAEEKVAFSIDRSASDCHTPRRNAQIEAASWVFEMFHGWCERVCGYFSHQLFTMQQEHGLDLSAINADEVFVPVVPLFDANARNAGPNGGPVGATPLGYLNAFLDEERRSLTEKFSSLGKVFPESSPTIITAQEARLLTTLIHAMSVCRHFAGGVDHIESMLRTQLIAAIGKEVMPADFARYMDFHLRRLFKPAYRPVPFSHAVRRPDHDPEGVVSIEAQTGRAMSEPISTLVSCAEAPRAMNFPLGASTQVSFQGERYLHAWVTHQFSGHFEHTLSLVARARQFSSFILLVGRITSADTFDPRYGIIVQNKDLLKIPLMLEQIPTPKEFRDAIESLSPEQQRFAKAFRSMQLESTLFGVCVLQIKPQLERLLKLPDDSLTKEIKLTQDLLTLFMEYQIPSDLLSYDGPEDAPSDAKLTRVREYVARMQQLIDTTRQRELEEAQEREAFRLAESDGTPRPRPAAPSRARAAPVGAPPQSATMMAPPPAPGAVSVLSAAMPVADAAPTPPSETAAFGGSRSEARPEPSRASTEASQPPRNPQNTAAVPEAPSNDAVDYTRVPAELDRRFEALDEDAAVRPSIINTGDVWSRTAQKSLLAAPAQRVLAADEQKTERNKTFDLIDALSKSGAIPFEHASLHVVIAGTHCFDQTLLDTVVCANVNPIEKVERSVMIAATTIHRASADALLDETQRARFFARSPRLADRNDKQ